MLNDGLGGARLAANGVGKNAGDIETKAFGFAELSGDERGDGERLRVKLVKLGDKAVADDFLAAQAGAFGGAGQPLIERRRQAQHDGRRRFFLGERQDVGGAHLIT